jgi:phage FluMu gp28-like protein
MSASGPPSAIARVHPEALPLAPDGVLLPYQQRWVADPSPFKLAEKSRRIGLTWAEASDDVLIAAREGGTNVFYIGPTQDMALEYIEACALFARAYAFAASAIGETIFEDIDPLTGESKAIKSYRIDFPASGRRVLALSSRPQNLRGKQGVIVIDEAAFHPDLASLLKAAMAMLLWGDKVRVISTHDGADSPFAELITEVRTGRRPGSVHRIAFREAVADGLYRRVCLRRGIAWTPEGEAKWVRDAYDFYGDDAAEELDVVPSNSGGAYLPLSTIEARMDAETPVVRGRWSNEFALLPRAVRDAEILVWCEEQLLPHLARLDAGLAHALGEDFGRVADLTVLAVGDETRSLIRRVRLVVELANCPFGAQELIVAWLLRRLPRLRGASFDATGNGAALAENIALEFGASRIEQVKLSQSYYLEHMPRFKAALEDATLIGIPRDRDIRDDLRALRVKDGVPGLGSAPSNSAAAASGAGKQRRHGDAAIALFLLHRALTREGVPIGGQGTGEGRVADLDGELADFLEMGA